MERTLIIRQSESSYKARIYFYFYISPFSQLYNFLKYMSIIGGGGGGFFADLRNWRDSIQEELMVVMFEAEVKTPESGVALSRRYQVEVSIRPTQLLQCSN